jgi:hypothetical protein
VASTASLVSTIGTLQQCLVALESQGPPRLPPFALYLNDAPFAENYGFIVRCRCCAVRSPVSVNEGLRQPSDRR